MNSKNFIWLMFSTGAQITACVIGLFFIVAAGYVITQLMSGRSK